ncbi:endoplasmic reticulum metallopeptidase 1-like [Argonauta hians]
MDSVRQRRVTDSGLGSPSSPTAPLSSSSSSSLAAAGAETLNPKKTKGSLSGFILFPLILVFHVTLFTFINHRINTLPTPLKTSPGGHSEVFEEESARKHLDAITGLGQRPVGSYANEVLAKDYITDELEKIRQGSLADVHTIRVDEQTVDGQFSLHLKSNFLTVYRNIKNIVVRLDPVSKFKDATQHSVLVNCHYDSVVGSPGAGDDACSCAVMLEVLRSLSRRRTPLRHSIIFLFNSAEENMLQASHGFITQHEWAKTIRAFVNLDAAGAGGWEIVFQAGPQHPWLIQAYANSVKYPFASILGQEIFQGGLVPSDTDYQIFQKFGNIPGLDIAYVTNGYVYHTKNDRMEFIQPGCIQRGGENLKNLLETIASTPKLADPGADRHGNMVFYDIVGLFMLAYPKRIAGIINIVIVLCNLLVIFRRYLALGSLLKGKSLAKSLSQLLGACVALCAMWVCMVAAAVVSALVLNRLGRTMCWYNHSINIVWVFIIPGLTSALTLLLTVKHFFYKNESVLTLEQLFCDANIVIWCSLLSVLTYHNIGSAYLLSGWLLMCLVAGVLKHWLNGNMWHLLVCHVTVLSVPTLLTMYMCYLSLLFFMPIMGRVGSFVLPDVAVAVMTVVPLIVISGFTANLWMVSSDLKKVIAALSVVSVIGFSVVLFTDYGFPYSLDDKKPAYQRLILQHIRRRFHDESGQLSSSDSGLWFVSLDHNGLRGIQEAMPSTFDTRQDIKCEGPYCGWPYYYPILWIIDNSKSAYIPVNTELRSPSVEAKLQSRRRLSRDKMEITVSVSGPDHMTLYVMPDPKATLESWSLSKDKPRLARMPAYTSQKVYFIYYSHAVKPDQPWTFSLEFTVPPEWPDNATVTDIAFCGHYMHGGLQQTAQLTAIEDRLPPWVTSVSWTATYDNWKF